VVAGDAHIFGVVLLGLVRAVDDLSLLALGLQIVIDHKGGIFLFVTRRGMFRRTDLDLRCDYWLDRERRERLLLLGHQLAEEGSDFLLLLLLLLVLDVVVQEELVDLSLGSISSLKGGRGWLGRGLRLRQEMQQARRLVRQGLLLEQGEEGIFLLLLCRGFQHIEDGRRRVCHRGGGSQVLS
jgi:hypothetical protein